MLMRQFPDLGWRLHHYPHQWALKCSQSKIVLWSAFPAQLQQFREINTPRRHTQRFLYLRERLRWASFQYSHFVSSPWQWHTFLLCFISVRFSCGWVMGATFTKGYSLSVCLFSKVKRNSGGTGKMSAHLPSMLRAVQVTQLRHWEPHSRELTYHQ